MEESQQGYRGPSVCKIVGISYRQLDYWATKKIVTPSVAGAQGSGSRRLYSFGDIVELRVIKKLLDAGVSLPKIRRALDFVRRDLQRPLKDVTLVSDGRTIHACLSPSEVVDALNGGQAVFAVAVGRVMEDMAGEIARLPVERETTEVAEVVGHVASEPNDGVRPAHRA